MINWWGGLGYIRKYWEDSEAIVIWILEMTAEKKEFDDVKNNKNSKDEKVVYKLPRLFRNSFVHKTLNLFYPGYGGRGIANRNIKEK